MGRKTIKTAAPARGHRAAGLSGVVCEGRGAGGLGAGEAELSKPRAPPPGAALRGQAGPPQRMATSTFPLKSVPSGCPVCGHPALSGLGVVTRVRLICRHSRAPLGTCLSWPPGASEPSHGHHGVP